MSDTEAEHAFMRAVLPDWNRRWVREWLALAPQSRAAIGTFYAEFRMKLAQVTSITAEVERELHLKLLFVQRIEDRLAWTAESVRQIVDDPHGSVSDIAFDADAEVLNKAMDEWKWKLVRARIPPGTTSSNAQKLKWCRSMVKVLLAIHQPRRMQVLRDVWDECNRITRTHNVAIVIYQALRSLPADRRFRFTAPALRAPRAEIMARFSELEAHLARESTTRTQWLGHAAVVAIARLPQDRRAANAVSAMVVVEGMLQLSDETR
ncbi:hypothetical protein H9P43_006802 [Blastocladiella emersonii ATCC 22665]|nr:hypothetical protein H9P43_006802 [Blastocladiella emersonii ATCC 22665]